MDWNQIYNDMITPGVSIIEKIIRTIIVYLFLVIGLRVFGRRELAQLGPGDFVVLLLLSNTVQNAIIGNDNSLSGGLIGAFSLLVLNSLINSALVKFPRLARWFAGSEIYLIRNGMLMKRELSRQGISLDELMLAIHKQGLDDISEVQVCILEPDGSITVKARKSAQDLQHIQDQLEIITKQQQKLLEQLQKTK